MLLLRVNNEKSQILYDKNCSANNIYPGELSLHGKFVSSRIHLIYPSVQFFFQCHFSTIVIANCPVIRTTLHKLNFSQHTFSPVNFPHVEITYFMPYIQNFFIPQLISPVKKKNVATPTFTYKFPFIHSL